jgi:hypothetical protein
MMFDRQTMAALGTAVDGLASGAAFGRATCAEWCVTASRRDLGRLGVGVGPAGYLGRPMTPMVPMPYDIQEWDFRGRCGAGRWTG